MVDVHSWDPKSTALMQQASSDDVSLVARAQPGVLSLRARSQEMSVIARALSLAALPAPNTVLATPLGDCAWVRPDEWLLISELTSTTDALAAIAPVVADSAGAIIDISASRVELELRGPRSRDVLASACPLDLHPKAFAVGRCAQSLIAKAPIFLHLTSDEPRWRLLVRPSLVGYVVSWLTDAMSHE